MVAEFLRGAFVVASLAVLGLVGACAETSVGTDRRAIRAIDAGALAEDAGSEVAVSCSNGVRDGDETDIDCGGAMCPRCANAASCASARDCVSRVCTDARCSNDVGCSDGTREGFASLTSFPNIAACAGGWSIAGLVTTTTPACDRAAGNSSENPNGEGCNVADLCQVGWNVCASVADIADRSANAGCSVAEIAGQNGFFVARQSGPGNGQCGAGNDDLFGCGDIGAAPDVATCGSLDRSSGDLCASLPAPWACGVNGVEEASSVTKSGSEHGGVLCCRY